MSRGFAYFLVFCVILGITAVGTVYYIGWGFTAFALDGDRRNKPVQVLRLERITPGDDFDSYLIDWLQPMDDLIESHSGKPVSVATTRLVVRGQIRERWDVIAIERFSSGRKLIDLLTSPPYRDLSESIENRQHFSARYVLENTSEMTWRGGDVLFFIAFDDAESKDSLKLLESSLYKFKGREVWRSVLTVLRDSQIPAWQLVISFRFPEERNLYEWVEDAEQLTNTAITGSLLDRLVIVVTDVVDQN